jgi:hypothetical protein
MCRFKEGTGCELFLMRIMAPMAGIPFHLSITFPFLVHSLSSPLYTQPHPLLLAHSSPTRSRSLSFTLVSFSHLPHLTRSNPLRVTDDRHRPERSSSSSTPPHLAHASAPIGHLTAIAPTTRSSANHPPVPLIYYTPSHLPPYLPIKPLDAASLDCFTVDTRPSRCFTLIHHALPRRFRASVGPRQGAGHPALPHWLRSDCVSVSRTRTVGPSPHLPTRTTHIVRTKAGLA